MEKKVMKYAVLQGVMASDGCGDSNMQAEFSNKKDALKYFNRVKKVTRDWYKNMEVDKEYTIEDLELDKEWEE